MTGDSMITLRWAPDAGALADAVVDWLRVPQPDPFTMQVVTVPDAGAGRWLAQQAALRLGSTDGDGVCAGVEFPTLDGWLRDLVTRACGIAPDSDPWRAERLVWTVLDALEDARALPWAAPLWAHLDGSEAAPAGRWSQAARIAHRFERYAERAPELIDRWRSGDGEGWQAELWRACRHAIDASAADPVARVAALCDEDLAAVLPERLLITRPGPLLPGRSRLLRRIGAQCAIDVVLPLPARSDDQLSERLGARAHRAAQDWAALAHSVPEPLPSAPRPRRTLSVDVHGSHGPDRQVEVLRDVLTGLLQSDAALQPRDIVVVCPQLERFAPHLRAAFSPVESAVSHPGRTIRVQLTSRRATEVNPALGMLLLALDLSGSRRDAPSMAALITHPAVAARFGWTPDDIDRLTTLIRDSGVRWGLDASQQAEFGVPTDAGHTWQTGLDALSLGVAMDATDQPVLHGVVPFDDAESDTVRLIGDLALAIDALSEFWAQESATRPVGEWSDAAQRLVTELAGAHDGQPWQIADARQLLAGLAADAGDAGPAVTLAEFRAALRQRLVARTGHRRYGTGATLVCGPRELTGVPHRVVCLLGFDADAFPRADGDDGDDLTRDLADADGSRARDRQALLDAVDAAQERLIVVYRAHDPVTNAAVPPSIPLAEVLAACPPNSVTDHPLQAFSPRNFDSSLPVASFDERALAGARALQQPSLPTPDPHRLPADCPPGTPPELVLLSSLEAFLKHPVRAFLRYRAGLTATAAVEPLPGTIPLSLDPLQQWSVGDRALSEVLAGGSLDAALQRAQARGALPYGREGERVLAAVASRVGQLATTAEQLRRGAPEDHLIALDVPYPARGDRPAGTVRLSGTVRTYDGTLVDIGYGRVGAKHRLSGWVRLLALGASAEGMWRWIGAGKGAPRRIGAPPETWNLPGLTNLVELYLLGLESPLPLPPQAAEAYADGILRGLEPSGRVLPRLVRRAYEEDFELDADWARFYPSADALLASPADPLDSRHYAEPSRFGTLARRVWEPLLRVEGGDGR